MNTWFLSDLARELLILVRRGPIISIFVVLVRCGPKISDFFGAARRGAVLGPTGSGAWIPGAMCPLHIPKPNYFCQDKCIIRKNDDLWQLINLPEVARSVPRNAFENFAISLIPYSKVVSLL